ncbi:hypothetical protein Pan153_43430 [Gimesia panareensis]|uniref:Limonene hydroxylase n=1 Tax=Gimesia panareensis TaxID=2527978 RepID=A0A518FTK0_9PLAN|nr:hypothetical protein [Gimesia panareensis]QDV19677.1 hypothetical protein Pan153_43430 [Gimesia panareensis]
MGFFDQFSGERDDQSRELPDTMPWDIRPSIYDHLCLHIVSEQPGLVEAGYELPDEERVNEDLELRWAAGALDGVMTHHSGGSNEEERVEKTVSLLLTCCDEPTAFNKYRLYQHIVEEHIVALIDAVIARLLNEPQLKHERLYELAYSFATESPDRETVKFGIAILGLYQVEENTELFLILGRHDEFTLFCAVALSNVADDGEQALWELAQHVFGWGRIHTVERLANTENGEIKDWLLREGFRNAVLDEYLAYVCATTGGLLEALRDPLVDRDLLTAAGELIEALINGGPAEDMDDYEEGATVVELYLQQLAESAESLADFLHTRAIQLYLSNQDVDWDSRVERGWTSECRQELQAVCHRILEQPEWPERVRQGLESADESLFFQANQAARVLKIPTWDHHWKRLQQSPHDASRWFHLLLVCEEPQLPQVLEFAEQQLDLAQIASGPGDALGVGKEYQQHGCLDYILQELRRFPGQGAALIEAGLRSPVVRNRNMAVAALATWGEAARHFEPLKQAVGLEPNESLQQNMEKLLDGQQLEE